MSIERARTLRKQMTMAEARLWKLFRSRRLGEWKFRRQHPIGRYITDFACVEAKLIIEVDGGQHADNSYDVERTKWLEQCGWRVIRFWNTDVLNQLDGVADMISAQLNSPHLPIPSEWAPPSPIGERVQS